MITLKTKKELRIEYKVSQSTFKRMLDRAREVKGLDPALSNKSDRFLLLSEQEALLELFGLPPGRKLP